MAPTLGFFQSNIILIFFVYGLAFFLMGVVIAVESRCTSRLTRRESEVLQLVSEGSPDKEIAARLCISPRTVKNHMHNILDKLHLQDQVQAATYALRQGLIQQPEERE